MGGDGRGGPPSGTAASAMREPGRSARIILDEMDDLVALLDREGRIVDANKAALAAAGASLSDIAGVPLWSISIWPADRAERVHLGCQRAAAGELHRESIDLQSAGGAVPIDLSLKPIAEGGAIQLILAEGRRSIDRSPEEE